MTKKEPAVWVWRQLMRLAIIVIGFLPLFSSQLIADENRFVVFALAGAILIISALGEIWKPKSTKKKRDITRVLRIQILAHFLLLTAFLQFFGHINGPLFLLYLPVIMEAFFNRDIMLGNILTITTMVITGLDYAWLVYRQEVAGLFSYLEFIMRILALVFVRAYGLLIFREIIADEKSKTKVTETTDKLTDASRELKKANVKLKELSALKDEFVSVASHELRAPMTTIKGYLAMILDGDAGEIPDKVKEFLDYAYEANDRMIRLINNMLNVSRIESGRLVISLKDIRLGPIIKAVVKEYQLEAKKHGLKLIYEKPKRKLPKVRVDPDRIREIIANLVGNAINFTSAGQVIVRNQLQDGMLITQVEDTGVGISKENQKELFKKFSQVNGARAPLKKGSGLGLYICRMLLNEFNGKIWLKSRVGRGTTFFFSLPVIRRRRQ